MSLYIVNRVAFVKEVDYVFCVVQMEALNINYAEWRILKFITLKCYIISDTQDLYSFSIFTAYSEYVREWPVCQYVSSA
jgi:hypothetical protein